MRRIASSCAPELLHTPPFDKTDQNAPWYCSARLLTLPHVASSRSLRQQDRKLRAFCTELVYRRPIGISKRNFDTPQAS